MPLFIEMRMVIYTLVLEINCSESIALSKNISPPCSIENRYAVVSADIYRGVHHLF